MPTETITGGTAGPRTLGYETGYATATCTAELPTPGSWTRTYSLGYDSSQIRALAGRVEALETKVIDMAEKIERLERDLLESFQESEQSRMDFNTFLAQEGR